MAFAAARMILKDKRRKSKEEFPASTRNRSKVFMTKGFLEMYVFLGYILL